MGTRSERCPRASTCAPSSSARSSGSSRIGSDQAAESGGLRIFEKGELGAGRVELPGHLLERRGVIALRQIGKQHVVLDLDVPQDELARDVEARLPLAGSGLRAGELVEKILDQLVLDE